MPENPETKPEEAKPQGEKPSEKPEGKPQEHVEQAKARGRFVKYQELSKDELVSMLLSVNKRLTRVNKELKEIINILYYGAPQEGGGQNSGYQRGYRRNYGYKRYGGRRYGQRHRNEEDVNYE